MARAIRSRTIEKGNDPREFALVAFGGAGPLHAAEVADLLEIPEVLVPPYPGITSAGGLLTSDLKYDQMRTVFQMQGSIDAERLNRELDELADVLRGWLRRDGVDEADIEVIRALDCRYVGQGYELRVTLEGAYSDAALEQFHRLHEREYGSAYGDPIEIVNARVTAVGKRPALDELPVSERQPGGGVPRRERRALPRQRRAAGGHEPPLRPPRAAARRAARRARRDLPPRHDDGRPAGLDAPGRTPPETSS